MYVFTLIDYAGLYSLYGLTYASSNSNDLSQA